ncbi:hypothetical protein [Paenibacillus tianjinensis]|uniref:CbrC family protein n=1 Tax=Paenibacillus tianjinensis TaxID=2810347 RepID=A0ABX7L5S6_9BACL|nr:hypothetical protein [Paenibacillus tianjinensis]QSF43448.1 hypothetical protein JRJ22_19485 [Paenibacillus tianjinensis]
MSNSPRAIEDFKDICFKCLAKKITTKYSLYRSNYGSSFDNNYTYMQICDECKPKDIEKWFDEDPELIDGWCEDYKYEDNIIEFVNTFPVEGQELFWNRCAYGACADTIESQDWIGMQLGILPDEVYEDYGMYSPRQIKAYKERFPVCKNTYITEYEDGSRGSSCPYGAFGDENGADGLNISSECYECSRFQERGCGEQINIVYKSQ